MIPAHIVVAGGTGQVRRAIVHALLARGSYQVSVLSRVGSESMHLATLRQQGVRIVAADDAKTGSLVQALRGADTLVGALGYQQLGRVQRALIRAAKEAGLQRVVPFDCLVDAPVFLAAIHRDPSAVEHVIAETGLAYTRYFAAFCWTIRHAQLEAHLGEATDATYTPVTEPCVFSASDPSATQEDLGYLSLWVASQGHAALSGVDNAMFPAVQPTSRSDFLKRTL
ncbi:hypothetical protein THASP1DRAFT_22360 [Thamnocephalis sphaerospora]|uniref:NmrA-like domain-containing protein n=1 Tax=Thamnocephalis sphaerospora TaxID=78915 RepID=A0A4P9XUE9_9FUNG|nr:hypothetical protein THASP1DRAFT_22360 [Thamnocephalis sphaerospora]|eukprot:RKP09848.1 hypothetical protein THASP1DRAFT_22360 [Thamnocephalis sphaerospora]